MAFSLLLVPLTAAAQEPAAVTIALLPQPVYAVTLAPADAAPALWQIAPCGTASVPSVAQSHAVGVVTPVQDLPQVPTWCAEPVPAEALAELLEVLGMAPTRRHEE